MQTHLRPLPSWQDLDLVTLAEAARIAGRSYSWARDCAVDGRLQIEPAEGTGPILVTVTSLKGILGALAAMTVNRKRPLRRGAHLRLVINNTH